MRINPEQLPVGLNAIIFLNYKPVGNFSDERLLLKNSPDVKELFGLINDKRYAFKIGFDSCMVSGIVQNTQINPVYFDACESGRFSAFISEDLRMYHCSFMIDSFEGIDLKQHSMLDVWQNGDIFKQIRSTLRNGKCTCDKIDYCYGGCPVFGSINLCDNSDSLATVLQGSASG